jgi:hypothetical protein
MKEIYDIRQQMPQFAANFFKPFDKDIKYPKMMTHTECGKLKPYLASDKKPVIVQDEEAEKAFLASKTAATVEVAKAIDIPAALPMAAMPLVRPQFEAVDPATVNPIVKRRGRPPAVKLPQDLK